MQAGEAGGVTPAATMMANRVRSLDRPVGSRASGSTTPPRWKRKRKTRQGMGRMDNIGIVKNEGISPIVSTASVAR